MRFRPPNTNLFIFQLKVLITLGVLLNTSIASSQDISKKALRKYSEQQLKDTLISKYNQSITEPTYHLTDLRKLSNALIEKTNNPVIDSAQVYSFDTVRVSNKYTEYEIDTSLTVLRQFNLKSFIKARTRQRNALIHEIYSQSHDLSHFTFALLNVGDSITPSFDANVSSNFFVSPTSWPVGLVLNPMFKLRMFLNQPSAPIRTPSNMIGATLFRHLGGVVEDLNGYRILLFSFYHHSNGQDPGSYDNDGNINLYTGNFGVNHIDLGLQQGTYRVFNSKKINNYFRLSYQHDFIIGEVDVETGLKELEGEYGQDRIHLKFASHRIRSAKSLETSSNSDLNIVRWGVNSTLVLQTNGVSFSNLTEAINAEAFIYWKMKSTPSLWFTGSVGWLGHDYYNIYFRESTFIVRVGLAASISAGFSSW